MSSDSALAKLDLAQHALAECRTAMEAKQIADVAEAARVYLERTNASVETVNRATEIRTLAERQMGEFLAAMPKATGAQGTGSNQHQVRSHDGTAPKPATLAEIGITKKQSSRAQKLAAIPPDEFKERIAVAKASGGRLSTAAVLHFPKPAAAPFSLDQWKAEMRLNLNFGLRRVPSAMRAEAVAFLAEEIRIASVLTVNA